MFQGDVESIARKTPKQLVEMFENISGSSELSNRYDSALKAKEEAESSTVFAYNKQKGYKSERRQLKGQKEEAEAYHEMLERKARLKTEFYLWQLFHVHADIGEREELAEELRGELLEKDEVVEGRTAELKEAKKAASTGRRAVTTADKVRVKLTAGVDKLQPSIIKCTEEVKNLTKKVASDQKALAKVKREAETHGEKLAEISSEIEEYTEKEKSLREEYEGMKQSQGAEGGLASLTEEQEAEYENVREAAAVASAKPRQELNKINRKLESARAKAADVAAELEEVANRKNHAGRETEGLTERRDQLTKVGGRSRSYCLCLFTVSARYALHLIYFMPPNHL